MREENDLRSRAAVFCTECEDIPLKTLHCGECDHLQPQSAVESVGPASMAIYPQKLARKFSESGCIHRRRKDKSLKDSGCCIASSQTTGSGIVVCDDTKGNSLATDSTMGNLRDKVLSALLMWWKEPEFMIPEKSIGKPQESSTTTKPIIQQIRCHQHADSLFSTTSGFNNYRGMLNLGIILLAVSMGRVALENIIKYGILIDPIQWLHVFLRNPYSWPSVLIVLATNIFSLAAFWFELLLSVGSVSENTGHLLHIANLVAIIVLPAAFVLYTHPSPFFSSPALSICVMIFLKLISYKQVNTWCRVYLRNNEAKRKRDRRKSLTNSNMNDVLTALDNDKHGKIVEPIQVYPNNLYLNDLYYFLLAPTLCYQLNFPRSERIRKRFLIKRIIEMVFLSGLMLSLTQQWIIPIVNNSLVPFKQLDLSRLLERLLKLAVPNHLIWLLFFYWFFHSCLNVMAEMLRFGDRIFYRDWWNAESVSTFWQNWNIPVHKWARRHVYKPMLSAGYSSMHASVTVFLISAFFHEYLVSIPLQMFKLWAFSAMLMQVPLASITGKYLQGKMGNMTMWFSLIIGQPVAILMYYHDYYVLTKS